MARGIGEYLTPEAMGVMSLGLIVFAGGLLFARSRRRSRPTPEQMEERRRAWLAAHGKLSGGEIVDVQENSISYAYDVRGMGYTAWQDVSALQDFLPRDRWSIIGATGVRYDPRNPANSVVLCETWSGLRQPKANAG